MIGHKRSFAAIQSSVDQFAPSIIKRAKLTPEPPWIAFFGMEIEEPGDAELPISPVLECHFEFLDKVNFRKIVLLLREHQLWSDYLSNQFSAMQFAATSLQIDS